MIGTKESAILDASGYSCRWSHGKRSKTRPAIPSPTSQYGWGLITSGHTDETAPMTAASIHAPTPAIVLGFFVVALRLLRDSSQP